MNPTSDGLPDFDDAIDEVKALAEYVPGKYQGSVTLTQLASVSASSVWPDELSDEALKEAVAAIKPPATWVEAIEQLQQEIGKSLAVPTDILYAKMNGDPDPTSSGAAAGLFDLFRVKLGLYPFMEFADRQRTENITRRQLKERDWDRRTGRTTRGMLFAIAQFMVSDMREFAVVAVNERYTKQLANEVRDVYERLNLARRMPIRALMPRDYQYGYDYKPQRFQVFVDHSWAEERFGR
jgi:hypothetical protein